MKTYIISDATVDHPTEGTIVKEKITYYLNGVEELAEIYSVRGVIVGTIRDGYIPL